MVSKYNTKDEKSHHLGQYDEKAEHSTAQHRNKN